MGEDAVDERMVQQTAPPPDAARLRQRAVFLRELADARALLARSVPERVRARRLPTRTRGAL